MKFFSWTELDPICHINIARRLQQRKRILKASRAQNVILKSRYFSTKEWLLYYSNCLKIAATTTTHFIFSYETHTFRHNENSFLSVQQKAHKTLKEDIGNFSAGWILCKKNPFIPYYCLSFLLCICFSNACVRQFQDDSPIQITFFQRHFQSRCTL